ncbi:hypothetical protein [Sphingobacterium hotanense]|uniref:hypothetical protein n=1 Tax=Sphingobacterium hotanense TaxID=649196 RepID=UPI0021A43B9A|nr:hypothetical protein [Sphingobacterium hotanense]MCT1523834.1 hypothetical protein [Sphingobacterium hotanense]
MKFRSRHQKRDTAQRPSTVAGALQTACKRVKGGWAVWMAKRTAGFSRRRWQVLLALFIVGFGGYSGYLTIAGFTGEGERAFSITPIKKPRHAPETGDDRNSSPQVSEAEYKRIRRFRLYMDSLARSPAGKSKHDSMVKHRPGLMDSVRFIEKYYEQLKNK